MVLFNKKVSAEFFVAFIGAVAMTSAAFSAVFWDVARISPPVREESPGNTDDIPVGSWKYTFNIPGVLEEAASEAKSSSTYFWLSSGGALHIADDVGRTLQGALNEKNVWRMRYGKSNALDTDGGRYPQNIFRLISRSSAGNVQVSVSFKINTINTTNTPNRGAWSGIFLMSRFRDSENVYYSGIRQDGRAVIKKKTGGTYYTLAEVPVFENPMPYDADTNPNLIPGKTWMRIRNRTVNEEGGVRVEFFLDGADGKGWTKVLSVLDYGIGGPAHTGSGKTGIRSDFFDLELDTFSVEVL